MSLKKCVDDGAAVSATDFNSRYDESRREAFVAMVQPTDLRDGDDTAAARRLDWTRVRTIIIK
ncbi:MAG: hypothetical protein ACRDGM_12895 [bacterium]